MCAVEDVWDSDQVAVGLIECSFNIERIGSCAKKKRTANWSAMSWVLRKSMPRASVMSRMAFWVLPSSGYVKYVRTFAD